jgi:class 3 adenylate cyclase/tetratricopeptide (TPR) repeat protein
VTVLFADVAGFTAIAERLDPEDVHAIMNRCFELLSREIHRYEGTINQFLGDGLMALFGAPVALEDHAVRACHAALAIQETLSVFGEQLKREKGIDFRMRIGMNTGLVVVGAIGDDLRMDYTAVGDTTNLAARVQALAEPGAILVSRQTHQLVEGFFRTEPKGEARVKGRAEPVNVFALTGRRQGRSRLDVAEERGLTAFVGRRRELGVILDCLKRVRAGRGQVVVLVGEAGVGKSRLLYEFRRAVREEPVTVLEGKCVSYGKGIPYLPVLDVLKGICQIEEGDNPLQIREKVEQLLRQKAPDLVPLVPFLLDLLSVSVEDPAFHSLDAKEKRARTFEAIRALMLREVERQPLILVIEDLHWADRTTEEYLKFLADGIEGSPILLFLTFRSEHTFLSGELPHVTRIVLDVFSDVEAEAMVGLLLGDREIPPPLTRVILGKGEGNPLFLEEITTALLQRGTIVSKNGSATPVVGGPAIRIPDSIQDIIRARIDRLEDNAKRTLQTAAVIGREFSLRLLTQAAQMEGEVQRHLEQLKQLEFIYEKRFFPEMEFTFKHTLTQDVAYESLLVHRRRELHGVIARAMEEIFADRLEEHSPVLAYHYVRGHEAAKATDYLVRAGDRAMRLYANAEAAVHYTEALAQVEKQPESLRQAEQRVDVVMKLCGVSGSSADFQRDLGNLAGALSVAERIGDRRRQSQVLYWVGRTHYVLGHVAPGIEHAERALTIADELGDDSLAAMPVNLLGRSYFVMSDFKKACPILERNSSQLERIGNRVEAATAYAGLGWSLAMIGRFDRALQAADRGLAIAQEIGHLPTEAACYHYRACTRFPRGEWSQAIEDIRRAQAAAERTGDSFRAYLTTGFLGGFLVMTGEHDAGVEILERTFQAAERLGTTLFLSVFRVYRGEASLVRGETDEAALHCRQAITLAVETNDRWSEAWARRVLSEALCKGEPPNLAEAEREILEATRIQRQLGTLPDLARSLLAHGRLLRLRGEHGRGQELIAGAVSMFREMGMSWDLARAEARE